MGAPVMGASSKTAPAPRVHADRSSVLTIFWHCGFTHFSSRTALERWLGNKPSTVLAEDAVPKGLAMLIRSCLFGVRGGAASAVCAQAIPAASLPTLLIGGPGAFRPPGPAGAVSSTVP